MTISAVKIPFEKAPAPSVRVTGTAFLSMRLTWVKSQRGDSSFKGGCRSPPGDISFLPLTLAHWHMSKVLPVVLQPGWDRRKTVGPSGGEGRGACRWDAGVWVQFSFNRSASGFHGVNICGSSILGPSGGLSPQVCTASPANTLLHWPFWLGPRICVATKFQLMLLFQGLYLEKLLELH